MDLLAGIAVALAIETALIGVALALATQIPSAIVPGIAAVRLPAREFTRASVVLILSGIALVVVVATERSAWAAAVLAALLEAVALRFWPDCSLSSTIEQLTLLPRRGRRQPLRRLRERCERVEQSARAAEGLPRLRAQIVVIALASAWWVLAFALVVPAVARGARHLPRRDVLVPYGATLAAVAAVLLELAARRVAAEILASASLIVTILMLCFVGSLTATGGGAVFVRKERAAGTGRFSFPRLEPKTPVSRSTSTFTAAFLVTELIALDAYLFLVRTASPLLFGAADQELAGTINASGCLGAALVGVGLGLTHLTLFFERRAIVVAAPLPLLTQRLWGHRLSNLLYPVSAGIKRARLEIDKAAPDGTVTIAADRRSALAERLVRASDAAGTIDRWITEELARARIAQKKVHERLLGGGVGTIAAADLMRSARTTAETEREGYRAQFPDAPLELAYHVEVNGEARVCRFGVATDADFEAADALLRGYLLTVAPAEIGDTIISLLRNSGAALAERASRRREASGRIGADPSLAEIIEADRTWSASLSFGVRLTIAPFGDFTLFVRDNGPGVDPAIRPRIGHLFATTKGLEGQGLGLYMVRQVALAHQGAFTFSSSTTAAASFTEMLVVLPLSRLSFAAEPASGDAANR